MRARTQREIFRKYIRQDRGKKHRNANPEPRRVMDTPPVMLLDVQLGSAMAAIPGHLNSLAPCRHRSHVEGLSVAALAMARIQEHDPLGECRGASWPNTAPLNLVISGRHILQPGIFDVLETLERGAGREIQITDGMIKLASSQAFHGVRFDGQTYNCGSKLGFLTANIAFTLGRPDLAAERRAAIRTLVARRDGLASSMGGNRHVDLGRQRVGVGEYVNS